MVYVYQTSDSVFPNGVSPALLWRETMSYCYNVPDLDVVVVQYQGSTVSITFNVQPPAWLITNMETYLFPAHKPTNKRKYLQVGQEKKTMNGTNYVEMYSFIYPGVVNAGWISDIYINVGRPGASVGDGYKIRLFDVDNQVTISETTLDNDETETLTLEISKHVPEFPSRVTIDAKKISGASGVEMFGASIFMIDTTVDLPNPVGQLL